MSNDPHRGDDTKARTNRLILWGLVLLMFCSWVVLLGGISALTRQCYTLPSTVNDRQFNGNTAAGAAYMANYASAFQSVNVIPYPGTCTWQWGFQWWIVWFELFVLVMIIVNLVGVTDGNYWPSTWFFLAIVTTLGMMQIDNFLGMDRNDVIKGLYARPRVRAALAGFFLITIINGFTALFLPGWDYGEGHGFGGGKGTARRDEPKTAEGGHPVTASAV